LHWLQWMTLETTCLVTVSLDADAHEALLG